MSFSNEFSQQLIKLLASDIILRYMREKIQTIVDVNKNQCLPVLNNANSSNNNDDFIDGTITERSHVFESDDDEQRVKAPQAVSQNFKSAFGAKKSKTHYKKSHLMHKKDVYRIKLGHRCSLDQAGVSKQYMHDITQDASVQGDQNV